MLFTDSLFLFYFLPTALILLRSTQLFNGDFNNVSRVVLFTTTAVFYGFKEPWWLIPFFICIGFDFLWATLLTRHSKPSIRKWICFASVFQNLTLLAIFKYWTFIISNLDRFFPSIAPYFPRLTIGGNPLPLPPGISFYTFESLSFVIDVYRRRIMPPKNPLEFFAFIGMFPRFIAGPIVRYREMAHQFVEYDGMKVEKGLFLFAWGLFLKCCFADQFELFTEYAFGEFRTTDFVSAWIGVTAYAMQIYFDFSGYSLMAIGLGKCLGFDFPANFKQPYLATTLQDFWRRWHISLSTWLRDYLYIPLGGSKKGTYRTYLNIFLTMLIGGLWHGSQWTFVLWGAWHGFFLCLERLFDFPHFFPRKIRRVITLGAVLLGWVFFRSNSARDALHLMWVMICPWTTSGIINLEAVRLSPISATLCVLGLLYCFVLERKFDPTTFVENLGASIRPRLIAASMFLTSLLLSFSSRMIPFLYFQF